MNAYAIAYDNIRAERDKARLEAQRLKEQRDELVAACKAVLESLENSELPADGRTSLDRLRQKLAKH
jgi:hypothetical protein